MTYESRKRWEFAKAVPAKEKTRYLKRLDDTVKNKELIVGLLYDRGISSDSVESFLRSSPDQIPEPERLYGAVKAAEEIVQYAKEGKKIYIHGDYDCDGICATAILWDFLYNELPTLIEKKVEVMPYIPDRVTDGYGLSKGSLAAMLDGGAEVVITVDCGIRDKELIKEFVKESGVKVIVTDHHQPPTDIEEGLDYTVVHQMFPGNEYPDQHICGSGVVLLLTWAMRRIFNPEVQIDLGTPGLDLVGLATVTDMMPLLDVNRIFVKNGIDQLRTGNRPGIGALCQNAKLMVESIDTYHLGFVIGPRINAAGRIGSPMDALRLLVTKDLKTAQKFAVKLEALNRKRQILTEEILAAGREQVETQIDNMLYIVIGQDWPEGIVGLVAGKLLEQYGKPIIVASRKDNEVRASARSIPGFNITSALEKHAELLQKYGGHEAAAGFNLEPEKYEQFRDAIVASAKEELEDIDTTPVLRVDATIESSDVNMGTKIELEKLAPFGLRNRKPVLAMQKLVVCSKRVMGRENNHMRVELKGKGIDPVTCVMFDCKEDIEKIQIDQLIDVAGTIDVNEWNGETYMQFMVKEWRISSVS